MSEVSIIRAQNEHRYAIMGLLEIANMHYIPSEEMPELDLTHAWVALVNGVVAGFSAFTMLDETHAKTTLLAVLPEYRRLGIGRMLQETRMVAAKRLGATSLTTNADRPETIAWYKKYFGYREVGSLKKEHEFGLTDVDYWTTLETDLTEWKGGYDRYVSLMV